MLKLFEIYYLRVYCHFNRGKRFDVPKFRTSLLLSFSNTMFILTLFSIIGIDPRQSFVGIIALIFHFIVISYFTDDKLREISNKYGDGIVDGPRWKNSLIVLGITYLSLLLFVLSMIIHVEIYN